MVKYLMNKFALTKKGAQDFIKGVIAVTLTNIALMIPASLLYLLVSDLMNKVDLSTRYLFYGIAIVIEFIVLMILHFIQYNLVFFTTYNESGKRRINLAEKLRKLPISFFSKKDSADLTSIVLNDATTMEHLFSHVMPQFCGSIISTIIIAIPLYFFDYRLALAATCVLPISIIIVLSSYKIQTKLSDKKNKDIINSLDSMQEYIETIRDLKMNNSESDYQDKLKNDLNTVEKSQIKAEFIVAIFIELAQMILKLGIVLVGLVGSYLLVHDANFKILTFFMYLIVVSRFYEPMSQTLINLGAIIASFTNIKRMKELDNVKILDGKDNININNFDLEFNNVSFKYDDELVLNNISFKIKQNEITALIGPSGGGKSTVSKLCARFYDPSHGDIFLGGINLKEVNQEALLKYYSIVFQNVTLFNNTILENIRIGRKDATDEEVLEAAKKAMCDDFVLKFKDGYNQMIGENGSKLSGGERQRISIARAILKNAPIIILDEATASIDVENESKIQQALSSLIKDKTVIIIAHRMRTIEKANHIIVLKDGKICEEGSPNELLNQHGEYEKMVNLQR